MDRVAKVSNAPIICNKTMAKNIGGKTLMLGPRDKGLAFTTPMEKLHTISVDETIQLDGMSITGIKATHGAVTLKVGPLSKTLNPGPDERVGWGAIGFNIQLDGKSVVNLGDTLLHEKEWQSIKKSDVLMIPIGGKTVHNTMDEKEAIQAVKIIQPKLVMPCHYNSPALFSKKYNPADEKMFKKGVEKMGIECAILHEGESIVI
jgi:L-ascorbate metabolism protein UlaG (beta-lactamase superfamily)